MLSVEHCSRNCWGIWWHDTFCISTFCGV